MENQKNLQSEAQFHNAKITGQGKRWEAKFYHTIAAQQRYDVFVKLLGSVEGKKVLDLGAGDGWQTMSLLERGALVSSVDISDESIKRIDELSRSYAQAGLCRSFVMDAQHMTFEDDSFDIVVGHGILHHLPDMSRAVSEILRVLKPNGYAVFSEPLGMNPFINLYRKMTPGARTKEERPLSAEDLNLIRQKSNRTEYHFFELLTLLSKVALLLGLNRAAAWLEEKLLGLDEKLLCAKQPNKISVAQRLAWVVVMKFTK